jgi:hypothetical protein
MCFFLTSPFIELHRTWRKLVLVSSWSKLIVGSWCQTLQLRRGLKIAAISILVLLGIVVTREIFSGYTVWYFVVPSARLTVDGRLEQGWLHRGNHGENLFLTRRKGENVESYLIMLPRDRQGSVSSCGNWTAPRSPVFPIGDVNPPCWTFYAAEDPTPRAILPARELASGEHFVEFTADDGSRIKVSWR